MKKTQQGFTVIEVILFVTISALFLIIASSTLSGRNKSVQFTDSSRALESELTSVYQQTVNGVLDTSQGCRYNGSAYVFGAAGTSDGSCIFLGNIVEFDNYNASDSDPPEPSEIEIINVYGRRLTSAEWLACANPNDPLWCVDPVINTNQTTRIEIIPWGSYMSNSNDNSFAFGFFRNPQGAGVIPVQFLNELNTPADYQTRSYYLGSSTATDIGTDFEGFYCIRSADDTKNAAFDIGSSLRQTAVELTFFDARC